MKPAATIARSHLADMPAKLRGIERAAANSTREARRGLRAASPGRERSTRPAARQQLAERALPALIELGGDKAPGS